MRAAMAYVNPRLVLFYTIFGALVGVLLFEKPRRPSWTRQLVTPKTERPTCQTNPFALPGYLNYSRTLSENRWVPWDTTCSTEDLLTPVINRDPTLKWMRGRTVVLFGSSVDRQTLELFCALTKGEKVIAFPGTQYAPPPYEPLKEGINVTYASQPTFCYLKEYDFYLVESFHYGIDTTDRWRGFGDRGHWTAPGLAEKRLDFFLLPFLKLLNITTKVDLVAASSYEWDLMLGLEQSGLPTPLEVYANFTQNFIPFYQRRLREITRHVLKSFPHRTNGYPIIWRLPHQMARDDPAPLLSAAILRATEYVFNEPEWIGKVVLDMTGKMLLGSEKTTFYKDHTHYQTSPLGVVRLNFLLWHLRKAVGSG